MFSLHFIITKAIGGGDDGGQDFCVSSSKRMNECLNDSLGSCRHVVKRSNLADHDDELDGAEHDISAIDMVNDNEVCSVFCGCFIMFYAFI